MPLQDLAYRFKVSHSTVSRIFSSWLVVIDIRLFPLISWPEREQLWRTMPQCFMYCFGKKVTVVIDCFEVFESVGLKQAKLEIPAFLKGKSQLDLVDVENTRGIANV